MSNSPVASAKGWRSGSLRPPLLGEEAGQLLGDALGGAVPSHACWSWRGESSVLSPLSSGHRHQAQLAAGSLVEGEEAGVEALALVAALLRRSTLDWK